MGYYAANYQRFEVRTFMLNQVEIFHGLNDGELEALEASSSTRSFAKNTVVIHENDPADSLFVIESGKVKVYCSDKNGKDQ